MWHAYDLKIPQIQRFAKQFKTNDDGSIFCEKRSKMA